jgi:hypothetical protein
VFFLALQFPSFCFFWFDRLFVFFVLLTYLFFKSVSLLSCFDLRRRRFFSAYSSGRDDLCSSGMEYENGFLFFGVL